MSLFEYGRGTPDPSPKRMVKSPHHRPGTLVRANHILSRFYTAQRI